MRRTIAEESSCDLHDVAVDVLVDRRYEEDVRAWPLDGLLDAYDESERALAEASGCNADQFLSGLLARQPGTIDQLLHRAQLVA